ncbi:acetyl-CoA C-acetyltransferase [Bordetella genomosp. 4]|uniref:acetyl-CoA C-acetyltransferase n=1 Tax=Bordetella genomosp. 4 TaxID=463044 RepID=UPI000B9EB054|nr:acetyl-CoA C-acetyltransferase [Bordetella genomosp. 4]OZI45971.1 acetyl-CoA acetyltransferase [Bordetella genomosp. 4]
MPHAPIYVVDGARTPFLKARNAPGPFSAADLAVQAGRTLLLRQPFAPADLDEVIIGCAAPSADEVNIGRVIALRLGCGHRVPGWTVMRNCASGMQALDSAIANIHTGRSSLVLAGGVDALSRAPLLVSDEMTRWLARWAAARGAGDRFAALRRFPWRSIAPVIGLVKGLTDPVVGLSMGQTAENLATRFGISRQAMDEYAARSHARALAAREAAGREIAPLIDARGTLYPIDDGVRDDSTVEKLGKLRPVFDKPWGNITAGNSSQVTDGAALLLLASENAVKRWNLQPLGRIVDSQWAGLDPAQMGLGPVHAATSILQRHHLGLNDLDLWEINEAFAAQVLACLAAWDDTVYCREELGTEPWGALDQTRLNVEGGAIALGHPVGASGARIVLHLLQLLQARGLQRGMAAICIGGGQGGAMLLETEAAQ